MVLCIWETLASSFGERFTYGETPPAAWVREVGKLTADQVDRGLTEIIRREMEWPPTLPQFIGFCHLDDPAHGRRGREREATQPTPIENALPKPRNPQLARSALDEAKRNLKVRPESSQEDRDATIGVDPMVRYDLVACALCGGPVLSPDAKHNAAGDRVCSKCEGGDW